MNVSKIIDLCSDYYDVKTVLHCSRVAFYATYNNYIDTSINREIIYKLAFCHDLLEDTDCTIEEIATASELPVSYVSPIIYALTKNPDENYMEYIKRLKNSGNKYAYYIKLADMKDHLSQKKTLTDKLKEKYIEALAELL